MLRLPIENTLDREEKIMAEQFTTLASLTVDGKGSYGIGASAVPFSKDLYTYLRITDIKDDGTLNLQDLKSVDDEKASEYLLKPNDIVFARTGASTGRNYFYDGMDGEFVYAGFLIKFSIDEKKVNPKYIKYFCQSKRYKDWINSFNTGSTRGNINAQTLGKMPIPLIERTAQDALVSILSSIDEKIKKNNEINNNLFEQIKTICTAWLSDYKPFDGVMPSDWVETPLSDIAEFISGYSYKGTELTDSTIAMATIKNFDRKGGFKLDGYKEIIPSSKLKESQHAELFDTLVAHTDLTQNAEVIGNAEPVMSKSGYDDIVFSMDLVKVLPKKDSVSKFLIAAILQDKKFKAHCLGYVNGTTVLHLSKKALPEYKLFLPSDFSTLKPLDEVVTALYKQVSSNISENTYLEELRESLLPKLMSGELDVSDIEI